MSLTVPLWMPPEERARDSQMAEFQRFAEQQLHRKFGDGAAADRELWKWSVEDRASFWGLFWDFCNPKASVRPEHVVQNSAGFEDAQWFEGVRLNYAENLLALGKVSSNTPAIIFEPEVGERGQLTWNELERATAAWTERFQSAGIEVGDRVAAYLPNIPETIIAMLGATSLGAIWSSTSPDFGVEGVVDRFSQITPRALVVSDGYYYSGRWHPLWERVREIVARLPSVEVVYVVPYAGVDSSERDSLELREADGIRIESVSTQLDIQSDVENRFEQLSFDHPLFILFSSGTTGAPKCIVHGSGGTLLQHLKEHRLHTDLRPNDRLFYYTTCGWMMWNWMVSALASGCTLCLYDGSPTFPTNTRLFEYVRDERIHVLGTSARYLTTLMQSGFKNETELPTLRTVLSTGSQLPPAAFEYVYRSIKQDVCLSSISGGTDIISCFALGNPRLPVVSGEIQCLGLGMGVDVFDERGEGTEETGELVCTKPFPSRPIYFWNDPTGARYRASYFERYPGVWHHGDWAKKTGSGGLVIYGRSDAVLNPGGVRIGTAEIYRQTEQFEFIVESVVVGQQWNGDERIILFVKLRDGESLTPDRIDEIAVLIRRNLTARHVPRKVLAVGDIPRTVSGKVSEIAVRDAVNKRVVMNREALANPDSLKYFSNRSELEEP